MENSNAASERRTHRVVYRLFLKFIELINCISAVGSRGDWYGGI